MNFEVVIHADRLKHIVNIMQKFSNEIRLDFSDNGFKCRLLDPSHVIFIDFVLKPEQFEKYTVPQTNISFNIQTDELHKQLSLFSNKENITLTNQDDKLIASSQKRKLVFRTWEKTPDIAKPKLTFKSTFTIDPTTTSELASELSKLLKCGFDYLKITNSPQSNSLEMVANADNTNYENEITIQPFTDFEKSSCHYSIEYLKPFFSEITELQTRPLVCGYGTAYPMEIKKPLSDDGESYILFIIAPRVVDQ